MKTRWSAIFFRHQLRTVAGAALACGVLGFAAEAQAQKQHRLIDVVVRLDADSIDEGAHYRLLPPDGTPPNWVSPVNYRDGKAYMHMQVITKPSMEPTKFWICFLGDPTSWCSRPTSDVYTTTGLVTWVAAVFDPKHSEIKFERGLKKIYLMLRTGNNSAASPENLGAERAKLFIPTDVRIAVTLVPNGAKYVPPDFSVDAGIGRPGEQAPVPNDNRPGYVARDGGAAGTAADAGAADLALRAESPAGEPSSTDGSMVGEIGPTADGPTAPAPTSNQRDASVSTPRRDGASGSSIDSGTTDDPTIRPRARSAGGCVAATDRPPATALAWLVGFGLLTLRVRHRRGRITR